MNETNMFYCPYTNVDLTNSETTIEHIIPLAVGGSNDFTIRVNKEANKILGSNIDGEIAKDFILAMKRTKFDMRGHSNKIPDVVLTNSNIKETNEKIRLIINQKYKTFQAVSVRTNKIIEKPKEIEIKLKYNLTTRIKFVAKVALSAGYYSYGELFRDFVNHDELRLIMNYDPIDLKKMKKNIHTKVDTKFIQTSNDKIKILRFICSQINADAIVGLVPGNENLICFVGLMNEYIGMVNIPANTTNFPNDGDCKLGKVYIINNRKTRTVSYQYLLDSLQSYVSRKNA